MIALLTRDRFVFFNTYNTMTTNWTNDAFTEACADFLERKATIEELQVELDQLKSEILDYFRANELKEYVQDGFRIAAVKKTTKKYSRQFLREKAQAEEKLKAAKELEEETGACEVVVNEFNHLSVKSIEGDG